MFNQNKSNDRKLQNIMEGLTHFGFQTPTFPVGKALLTIAYTAVIHLWNDILTFKREHIDRVFMEIVSKV